ncbi:MAG: hypothetical protein DRO11_07690 [Methanobacteriota archaeon]|nr:MAG: hypothetical protein DRO11_07690 [Euryarchaeota archaeon]
MTVIVSFEYIGARSASLPSEVEIGYIHIYNPNNFVLEDWPIYVRFTSENFNFDEETVHEQGNNLRFRSLDGNLLNYFLGEWYYGELGEAYVQIPQLPANSTTKIKVTAAPLTDPDLSNFSAVSLEILEGLYAEWRFCHPSNNTIYDSSGSGWDGKIKYVSESFVNKTTGYYDIAFKSGWLGGSDRGGAICPFRSITKNPPFSWESFVYPSSDCHGQLMGTYEGGSGSQLFIIQGSQAVKLLVAQGDTEVETRIENIGFNEWHHVVGLFHENYISLYVDDSNTSKAVPDDLTDFNAGNHPLRIELDEYDWTTWTSGSFMKADFIRYWNRILSSDEISLLRSHYGVAVSRFPNKLCILNWTEDKPQVFIECS